MNEIWKGIKDYEGYAVSNIGRVKSLNYNRTGNERVLKTKRDKYGYLYANLYKDGVQKTFLVHRLVAEAFIPNPENKPFIDHINTIRDDDRAENLRWCTCKENCNNPITRQKNSEARKGEKALWYGKCGTLHPTSKPVIGVNKITGEEVRFANAREAERALGISHSSITQCCKGSKHYNSAGGYEWMYAN